METGIVPAAEVVTARDQEVPLPVNEPLVAAPVDIEPFRLFVDGTGQGEENAPAEDDYLENLTSIERQDLTRRLVTLVSNGLERILQPEKGD
jgi:hypothetical protein